MDSTSVNSKLRTIATQYAPIVYFHPDEKYFPITNEDYIKNCSLIYTNSDGKVNTILKTIENPNDIVNGNTDSYLADYNKTDYNYSLQFNQDNNFTSQINDSKEYIHEIQKQGAIWVFDDSKKDSKLIYPSGITPYCYPVYGEHSVYGKYVDLIYLFTFAYNGTLSPHYWDSESIAIRYKISEDNTYSPMEVCISAHGGYTWKSYAWVDKTLDADGIERIIIYCSKESHAMYYEGIPHRRLYNFGTDYCGKGEMYNMSEQLLILPSNLDYIPEPYHFLRFIGAVHTGFYERFVPAHRPKVDSLIWGPYKNSFDYIKDFLNENPQVYTIIFGLIIFLSFTLPIAHKNKDLPLTEFITFLLGILWTLIITFYFN